MIVLVRRSSVALLGCILILNLVLLAVSGVLAKEGERTQTHLIVLDAGHGAPDGGCVAPDGTQEAPLNLAVSLKLKAALEKRGFRVLMTRTDENGIHDSGDTIAQKKRADMQKRKRMRDASGADLFVSVHMNQFGQTQYSGAQVIYDAVNPVAKQAALCIRDALREQVDPQNERVPMSAPDSIYLMRAPAVPSLIVECGFLSNEAEREKLKTEAYQNKIAEAVADGIVRCLEVQGEAQSIDGTTTQLKR